MLRSLAFGAVSAVALISSAYAADISGPVGSPEIPYAGVNWSGFYVGVNGGYGWTASSSSIYATANDGGITGTSSKTNFDRNGGFGGGQIGYNIPVNRFVLGVETDIQGASISGSGSATAGADPHNGKYDVVSNAHREITQDWFGTVRGRVGYSYDQALIYFTGGFAYGGSSGQASVTMSGADYGSRFLYILGQHIGRSHGLRAGRRPGVRFDARLVC